MANGLPVIAADRGGLRELVDNSEALVPAENPEAIAIALHRLYSIPEELGRAARFGRQRAESFRWSTILPTYERCLTSAATAGKSVSR